MEQQTIHHTQQTEASLDPDTGGNASETLLSLRRMADAADAAIERACSGNAEEFLAANRQQGGQ